MATSTNRKPDFNVFCQGQSDKAPLREVGAAWKHEKGDGLTIQLIANAIDGKYVCFPRKEKEDTGT